MTMNQDVKKDTVASHWLTGNARQMWNHPHQFPAEIAWREGGIAKFRMLHKYLYAITSADFARQVLVTHHERYERSFQYKTGRAVIGDGLLSTDGPAWLKRRREILPAFKTNTMRRLVEASAAAAMEIADRWVTVSAQTGSVDIVAETQRLALITIGKTLLSTEIDDGHAADFGAAVRETLYLVRQRNTSLVRLPLWIPTSGNNRIHRTRQVLDEFLVPHIEQRRLQPNYEAAQDILQTLTQARDHENGEALDDQALLDETKTLFVSGFETTATALAWTLFLLSRHKSIKAQWQQECREVLNGRVPTFDDLERLPITKQILQEALRLYPPVYNMARECITDDILGNTRIKKGSVLLISIYGIHRSPAYWENPDEFRPERFARENTILPNTYYPFAIGKHVCIGAQFAMTEMITILAVLGSRLQIVPADLEPVGIRAQITLAPSREILLRTTAL